MAVLGGDDFDVWYSTGIAGAVSLAARLGGWNAITLSPSTRAAIFGTLTISKRFAVYAISKRQHPRIPLGMKITSLRASRNGAAW